MKEHQHLEWKETWRDEFMRWICGFANSDGGTLHIGRNDQGIVIGLRDAAKLLEDLPNKIRDLLGIIVAVNLRQEKGTDFIEIIVPAYPNPISYRGHYLQRSGSTLQELKGAALDRFLLSRRGRTWDGVPMPDIKVTQLSTSAIQQFRDLARTSGRLDPADLRLSKAALVGKLHLTEGTYLKRAAVLLFHEDPERYVTGAFVKIGFFRSASDLAYHDMIQGDLFTQVAKAIDLVRTKYLKAAITYQGIQRIERYPVPDAALREAVLNALVHRDYAIGAPVQIRVYEDRLSIWNPAVLPDGWTVKNLLRDHPSTPFNPTVANVFFRSGEIETWGRGIERIFTACEDAHTPNPTITFDGTGITLEFRFAPDYLKAFAVNDSVTDSVTAQVGTKLGLSGDQVQILRKCLQATTIPELMTMVSRTNRTKFRDQVLKILLAEDLVAMTIPDKPTSSNQRYQTTPTGKAMLKQADEGDDQP